MSATLRYDIGLGAANLLALYEGSQLTDEGGYAAGDFKKVRHLLQEAGARRVDRWAGVRRGGNTNHVVTLAVKLPAQIELGYLLMDRAYWLACNPNRLAPGAVPLAVYGHARSGLRTLANKLSLSMGIGDPGRINHTDRPQESTVERGFLVTIHEAPGQLANWMAYADWLSERDDPKMTTRGKVIVGWLAKKALKMKYGVPVIAQPEKWSWMHPDVDRGVS